MQPFVDNCALDVVVTELECTILKHQYDKLSVYIYKYSIKIAKHLTSCFILQASGSLDWAQGHIEGFKKICMKYVEFNQPISKDVLGSITPPTFDVTDIISNETQTTATPVTATTVNPNKGLITPEFLEQLKDVTCPYNCFGKGTCVKGNCPIKINNIFCKNIEL